MAVGINNGISGTDADGFTWNSEYPVVGQNNDTFQFRWNWWIAKVAIENLQSKVLSVAGDVVGDSSIFDSGDGEVPLILNLIDTGVGAGSYSLASLTVDSKGRITAISDVSSDYVPVTGGNFTGIVTVPMVTGASPGLAAATKDYVDLVAGGGAGTFVLTDGSVTMSSALEYDALVVTSNDDQVPNMAEVKNYVTPITNGLIANKLNISGGTMTGNLILNADPTLALQAATKDYVDTFLPLVGGTLTGDLVLNADPTLPLGTATKQYVDNTTMTLDGINSMVADLDAGTNKVINVVDPTNPQDVATKAYVDFVGTACVAILADGTVAMTADLDLGTNKIVNVVDPVLPQDSATKNYVDTITMTLDGANFMAADLNVGTNKVVNVVDPIDPQDAATKAYVDAIMSPDISDLIKQDGTVAMTADLDLGTNKIVNVVDPVSAQDAATKNYVDTFAPLSGATFTGDITLNADPTVALGAATKQYVDNTIPTDHIKQDGTVAMTADLDLGTNKIVNVVDPVSAQDAATKNYVDTSIPGTFESTQQTITSAGQLILSHGLSSTPLFMTEYLICTTAEHGYTIGDKVLFGQQGSGSTSVVFDSTNLTIRFANIAAVFQALDKTIGNIVSLTNTSWNYLIVART